MHKTVVMAAGVALIGCWAAAAGAEELKAPISATMFLNMTSRTESHNVAFDENLKGNYGPAPAVRSDEGVVQPDGSVRYGKAILVVRNPCPPGDIHYDPPPLPGRRR